MARILVPRLSSFGDVALLVPVIYSVASAYPQSRFTVMTRQAFTPLFDHLGFNINVLPLDTKRKHRGFLGLLRILMKVGGPGKYSHVADVHDVLRTKVIRNYMRLFFTKVAIIDKGRSEKAEMIESKVTEPYLKHATQRYLDVFAKLGFEAELDFDTIFNFKPRNFVNLSPIVSEKRGMWIGIAPFAQHGGKIYPTSLMEKVVATLDQRTDVSIFLFGAGNKEMSVIKAWEEKYPSIVSHRGKLRLDTELLLISYLDVMVSMDSANMHLASLVQVPVVSVWGATHPALGFYGFGQNPNNAVQLDLDCRPCSVFGNTPCKFTGDEEFKCLKGIAPQMIISQVDKVLSLKNENSNTKSVLSL